MKVAFLPDRGVVKVSGEDARTFLNGLVTTDVTLLQPGLGRFAVDEQEPRRAIATHPQHPFREILSIQKLSKFKLR